MMDEKKGFLGGLLGSKKAKKSPCSCGCMVLEEIPSKDAEKKDEKEPSENEKGSCCKQ